MRGCTDDCVSAEFQKAVGVNAGFGFVNSFV